MEMFFEGVYPKCHIRATENMALGNYGSES